MEVRINSSVVVSGGLGSRGVVLVDMWGVVFVDISIYLLLLTCVYIVE